MLQKWQTRPTIINPGSAPSVQPAVIPTGIDNNPVFHKKTILDKLHYQRQIQLALALVIFIPVISFGAVKLHSNNSSPIQEISKSTPESNTSGQSYNPSNNQLPPGSASSPTANTPKTTPSGSRSTAANNGTATGSSTGGGNTGGGNTGGGGGITGYYGPQLASDSLNNREVGKTNGRQISYRFKATHTGAINNIGVFFIYRAAGYFAGTGGSVHIALQTDDGSANHFPSGSVLATRDISDPMQTPFRVFTLNTPVTLTSGTLYHLVFTNTDPSPTVNWVSLDEMYQYTPGPQMQPTISDTDLALVEKYDGSSPWALNRNNTPIYMIHYSDGATQGMGYIDALSSSGLQSIGGSNVVEQTMTPSVTRSVSKVAVRLAKTGSAALKFDIKQGTTTVSTVSVAASAISSSNNWVVATLPSSITLTAGTSYSLVLSSASASYNIYPLQEGTTYNLTGGNNFTEGLYQYSTNGGSSYQKLNGRSDYDLQFYFQ